MGHVAHMGENRNAYRILVEKPERDMPLRRPRRRWGIILQWILNRIGRGLDWFDSEKGHGK
jgi:hypothetical protein